MTEPCEYGTDSSGRPVLMTPYMAHWYEGLAFRLEAGHDLLGVHAQPDDLTAFMGAWTPTSISCSAPTPA